MAALEANIGEEELLVLKSYLEENLWLTLRHIYFVCYCCGQANFDEIDFSGKYFVFMLFCSNKFIHHLSPPYFSENQCELCYTLSPFRPPRMPPFHGAPGEGERRGREMKETTSQFHTKKFEGKWEDFKYVAVEPALAAPGR